MEDVMMKRFNKQNLTEQTINIEMYLNMRE